MGFKIVHDRPGCIGCSACAAVDPDDWEMNADGKSDLKEAADVGTSQEKEVEEIGLNQQAAESCPVNVIHLFDKDGKKLI
jgi:ferredoxin